MFSIDEFVVLGGVERIMEFLHFLKASESPESALASLRYLLPLSQLERVFLLMYVSHSD